VIRTAFVSTYPPRQGGVATFTNHLAAAVGGREIVALHANDLPAPYPLEVHHRIRRDEPDDYVRTAEALGGCVDVVAIQHEFGLWGGPDGERVLDFVGALRIPAIATLHGVPSMPVGRQHGILSALVQSVSAAVVMSPSAATLLVERYGADRQRVHVVPHGIPELPLVDAVTIKPSVGMAGRDLLLSFGMLAPGKGYEVALAAMPAILAANPKAMYVIIGVTHPDVAAADGEAYRESLAAQVTRLGIGGHVQLVDRFVGRVELTRWLEAADVVITPHADNGHRAAGTVAYAMGAGRAVVSTPGPFALDLLRDGAGVIVPSRDPDALAAAVIELLADTELRLGIGRRAHERTRPMTWWHVADEYRALIARSRAGPPRGRPPTTSTHLSA
jgi:glycosyltransferase involved in cell wall biosynthesis